MMDLLLARRRMMMQQAAAPSDTYLTFTANTAGSTIAMQAVGSAPSVSLEYSTDGGVTWQTFTVGSTTITLANVGDKVKMRGTNARTASSTNSYNTFSLSGSVAASGDLTSLLNSIGGDETLNNYAFYCLFFGCSQLTSAPELPSLNISNSCYSYLFGNTSIVIAPDLPATTSNTNCYLGMFYGCTMLQAAPELPMQVLAQGSYRQMFQGCSSLNYVKTYMTNISASNCLYNWMNGVAATGELYCDPSLNIGSGVNGIPSGWTRYNLDGTPY